MAGCTTTAWALQKTNSSILHWTKPSTHVLMLQFFVIIQVSVEFEMQSKSKPRLKGIKARNPHHIRRVSWNFIFHHPATGPLKDKGQTVSPLPFPRRGSPARACDVPCSATLGPEVGRSSLQTGLHLETRFDETCAPSHLQASDKVVPVLEKKRCALGKCVSQKELWSLDM